MSGKKNQDRRSLLQSNKRRKLIIITWHQPQYWHVVDNRKLWEKLKYDRINKARKYKKFEDKNKRRNNKLKRINNNIDKETSYYVSTPKTSIKRIKYRTSNNLNRHRNSTIPVRHTPTAPSARLHQYFNSPETFQFNSPAEANYVALRRNIKPNRPKVASETTARKPKSIKLLVGRSKEKPNGSNST